jgi:hypothetical protein
MIRSTSSRMPLFFVAIIGTIQDAGVDPDALLLRHVQHIHRDDDRTPEEQELRKQVEAPLEGGGVRQQDDDIRSLVDDEIPGYPLLFRKRGQAVGPGEIDDPKLHSVRRVGALFLFHGFSGPIAYVLRQAGQDVENGRFPGVGLAHQGHEECPGFRLFLAPLQGKRADEDLCGLAPSQSDPRVGHLDDDQPAARLNKTDSRMEADPHPRQTADQGMTAGDVLNDPLLAVFEGGDR